MFYKIVKAFQLLNLLVLWVCVMNPNNANSQYKFSERDSALLDEISQASFMYFINEAHPASGLVRDKTGVNICSVAAQGFAFSALAIGAERGWIEKQKAQAQVLKSLRLLDKSKARHQGMFTHFIDMRTGGPTPRGYEDVASTIDTALLVGGMLAAGEYFGGEAKTLADKIYSEINWKAYLHPKTQFVHMAWDPDKWNQMNGSGHFRNAKWGYYTDETLLIVLLGISAPNEKFRLPNHCLTNWKRERGKYKDKEFIHSHPGTLFTYTFAQCFYDFSRLGPDPSGDNWFYNTALAVRSNRDWCRANAGKYKTYGKNRWGITACSSPQGYAVPGHQPRGAKSDSPHGGVLAPYGAAMAMPYATQDSLAALRHMRGLVIGRQTVWKPVKKGGYGFADAFNEDENWVSDVVLAIAQGPMLVMIENARSGLVWNSFMKNQAIQSGLQRAGYKSATEEQRRELLQKISRL